MKKKGGLGDCGDHKRVMCANNDICCGRCLDGSRYSKLESAEEYFQRVQREYLAEIKAESLASGIPSGKETGQWIGGRWIAMDDTAKDKCRILTRQEMEAKFGPNWRHNAVKIGKVPFFINPVFDDLLGSELSGAVTQHFIHKRPKTEPLFFRWRGMEFVITEDIISFSPDMPRTATFRRYAPVPPETVEDLTGKMLGIFDPVDRLDFCDRVNRPKNVLGIGSFEPNNFKS